MGSTDKRVTQLASSYVSNSILQNILSSINPDVIFNALLLLSLILRDTSSDSVSRDRNALFMAVQQLASNSDPSIRSQAVAFLQCIGL